MLDMTDRKRPPINLTLDPEVVREVDLWVAQQTYRTTRSAAIEVAIREWIERQKAENSDG
jgi:metal-responsive CopG/Arc/MetJ family transcriptional regulator